MSAVEDIDQERRITFCLYESWGKIAGPSSLPALKRLQRQEIETFKSNLVLLDLRKGQDAPTFQVIGPDLLEDIDISLVGRPLAEGRDDLEFEDPEEADVAALGIAKHMNINVDDFHDFIKHFPGGIKGCVKEMRAIRKGSNGANLVQQIRTIEEARNVLRDMPVIGRIRLKKMIISKDADEFCLLLAKRRGHDIDVLKVLDDQYTKIDPILKRAAFIKGNLKKEN